MADEPMEYEAYSWRLPAKLNETIDRVNAQDAYLRAVDRMVFEMQERRSIWSVIFAVFFGNVLSRFPRWYGPAVKHMDMPPIIAERMHAEQKQPFDLSETAKRMRRVK